MKAVVLAGGKGTRLAPYSQILPKPLMPIGDMPILEVLLRQMSRYGIRDVVLTVGHLAELLESYFRDGSRFQVSLHYSRESEPLGTAGPLSLIENLDQTFLVANGDVLTTLDLGELVKYHHAQGATATISMHQKQVSIDLGVIQLDGGNKVMNYIEKPSMEYKVSMGIYVFEPQVLNYIPKGKHLDFPDMVMSLLQNGERVVGYPFDGYWQDLGRPQDYQQAWKDFDRLRDRILGAD
ncbi:MAG: NDP-sugar synthase [Anaerolineales bacterium]